MVSLGLWYMDNVSTTPLTPLKNLKQSFYVMIAELKLTDD